MGALEATLDLQNFLPLLPIWYAVFLLSTTAHEAAHAATARLGGDDTAYLTGQVSLNPIPHVRREPFGTVVVPLLTFLLYRGNWMIGWASAPYDPRWEDRHPKRAAAMALAGPGANLLLAALAFGILKLGIAAEWWFESPAPVIDGLVVPHPEGPGYLEGLTIFLSILLTLNVLLFVFNLIPVPPLDGASVLAGFLPAVRRLRDHMRSNGMLGFVGIIIAWQLLARIYIPVLRAVVGRL